jgi:uncharacterized membrane protein
MNPDVKRHLYKTITYRLLSSFAGFVILFVSTKSYYVGITFSIFELVYKPMQYYVHERIWFKYINFGRKTK